MQKSTHVLAKLEDQKDSSRIDLSDCFIGDSGCHALHHFLKQEGSRVTTLELRGNNIGGPGAIALSDCVRLTPSLKRLELEWNDIGLSDPGMQALCEAIGDHSEIENVSLKNNKVTAECGAYLGNMIESTSSLHILDLRWNHLSASGARALLKGLKHNTTLISVELAGNSVPQDYLQQVEAIVKKNREFLGIADQVERTPLRLVKRRENYDDSDYHLSTGSRGYPCSGGGLGVDVRRIWDGGETFSGDDFVRQLKAKSEEYNVKMARNDRKGKEVERLLSEQTGQDMKKDFSKQIDGERMEKEQIVARLGRLQDELTRKQMKTEGQKKTLESQLDQAEREVEVIRAEVREVENLKKDVDIAMEEKVTELESALKQAQKQGRVKNEAIRAKVLVSRKSHADELEMIKREWDDKIHQMERTLKETKEAKEKYEGDNRDLEKKLLDGKLKHEQNITEIKRKVAQAGKQKADSMLQSLVQRVSLLGQAKQQYESKLQGLARETATQEREQAATLSQLEREANTLDEQLILAKKQKEMNILQNQRLSHEVSLKSSSLEKTRQDREELRQALTRQQNKHLEAVKQAKQEVATEREQQQSRNRGIQEKVTELEKKLQNLQSELQQIELSHSNFADQVSLEVAKAVRAVFAGQN